jgi:glutamine amidotransferase PdxT
MLSRPYLRFFDQYPISRKYLGKQGVNFAELFDVWSLILRKACVSSFVVAPVIPETHEKIDEIKEILALKV